jgi:hypothetical protein
MWLSYLLLLTRAGRPKAVARLASSLGSAVVHDGRTLGQLFETLGLQPNAAAGLGGGAASPPLPDGFRAAPAEGEVGFGRVAVSERGAPILSVDLVRSG